MDIIIVEDSRLARAELREMLSRLPDCTLVGESESVATARKLIDDKRPDLILLDIQLPDGDGFALIEQLDHVPQVIFTTAYDQHAVAAFEVNALDYLLKPIEADRLATSLERARSMQTEPGEPTKKKTRGDQLFIRDGERCHFVQLNDIFLCEIAGNYTEVHFNNDKALLHRSLNYLEQHLDEQVFFRANRQQLVNLNYVASIEPWITDGLLIRLRNGLEVETSRRQARQLRELLEI